MAEPAQAIETSITDELTALGTRVCEALTAGDINAALACYVSDAVVVNEDGERLLGRDPIGKFMTELTALNPTFTYREANAISNGDLALVRHSWSFKGLDQEGNPVEETRSGTGVAQRQENGARQILIDTPYNAD